MKFDVIEVIKKKIPKQTMICFITGIVLGWIVHFYGLTNKMTNWDDLNCTQLYGQGDNIGRWMLKYIHPLGGKYSISAVHGFLFIVFMSLAACLILEILQVKSTMAAIMIPVILITFPSSVSTMMFVFMAHTSAMGIFMVSLGVYLMRKYRFGFIPCVFLCLFTLGTYQSYICFAITLMLLGLLGDVIRGEKEFLEVVKKGVLCVVVLLISVLAYIKISHMIFPNMSEETYGGVGQMGQIAISEMPKLIGRCYKRFLEYFLWKPFAFVTKTAQVTNMITFALDIVLLIYLIIAKKIYQNIWNLLITLVIFGFLPLGAAFIYFMAPDAPFSMLMLYAYALVYVLAIALLEACMKIWETRTFTVAFQKIVAWCMVVITVCTVFVSCYSDYLLINRAYFRTDLAMKRVSSYFNRIIAMAESTEGFEKGDQLTILGNFYYKDNPSSVEIDVLDTEPLRTLDGVALENGLITPASRDNFIKLYVGYECADLRDSEIDEIMATQEYKRMSVYPETGCVKKIGEIWVVKLCD